MSDASAHPPTHANPANLPASPVSNVNRPVGQAQSILDRLRAVAKSSGEDHNQLLAIYGAERLLVRLTQSPAGQAAGFTLKGGYLTRQWLPQQLRRATMDADLTRREELSPEAIHQLFTTAASTSGGDDAVEFQADSIRVAPIRGLEGAGVRVTVQGRIANVRLPVQIDIGFGDVPRPEPHMTSITSVLPNAVPITMPAYHPATVLAEKYQTAMRHSHLNSRLKDYYDLAVLPRVIACTGADMTEAIATTFARRGTEIPAGRPDEFAAAFLDLPEKTTRWQLFLQRNARAAKMTLHDAGDAAWRFLELPTKAARGEGAIPGRWDTATQTWK